MVAEPKLKPLKTELFEQPDRPKMSVKINPPDLKSAKNYECFKNELQLWQSLTTLEATKQAGCIALNLPNDCIRNYSITCYYVKNEHYGLKSKKFTIGYLDYVSKYI